MADIQAGADSPNIVEIAKRQFATFLVAGRFFGIEVAKVQEITHPLPLTPAHLAPQYVLGMINLRGQIATVVGLRELFQLSAARIGEEMTVVCRHEGALLSLIVDEVGDVLEVSEGDFEPVPNNVDENMKRFLRGVYKTPEMILSVIEISQLFSFLSL
jgi:purine-binding chemotaxis protein CheW